jgi:hypothetical protein
MTELFHPECSENVVLIDSAIFTGLVYAKR